MSGRRFTYDECGKTIVRGTMDAGINNVIYMELYSGPKMANGRCGKTIDTGTIDRGSAVYIYIFIILPSPDGRTQNLNIFETCYLLELCST